MRRIKLVVGVLAMLVVMVGSAVPAMAQQRGDHGNRGYDYGRANYYNYWNPSSRGTILLIGVLSLLTMAGTTSSK